MSILLIHGVGGRPRSWDRVLACLEPDLRTKAIAVDADAQVGQSMPDMAQDLLEHYPGSHAMVGHSFGGMLAQEAALIDPSRIDGLVLVSSIPGATPHVAAVNDGLASSIENRGLENVASEFGASLFAPGRLDRSPELGRAFVADMLQAGQTSVCAALRAIANWDACDRLPTLDCPARVLAGDAETDLDRQSLLAKLLGAPFTVLDDTGHLAPIEAPNRVATAIAHMADQLK